MNMQPTPEPIEDETEPPTCARCDEPGVSFVVEVREQGDGMWLCQRHLTRLQGQIETVPELEGMFDGALVITEITPDKIKGQGRAQ